MRDFFSIDSPFSRVGNLLADIMILGFIWFVFSIPIVTMGASTTALYYVATKRVSNKEGYITKDFWKSFKANFSQSTFIWLGILLFYISLFLGIFLNESFGKYRNFILPFQLFLLFELVIVTIYIFPLMARFHMKPLEFIKIAFIMGNRHILTTLLALVIAAGVFLMVVIFPPVFLIGMSLYAFSISGLLLRIFKKYHPELDEDISMDNFSSNE